MGNILALKDHPSFKSMHGSCFPRKSKDKVFNFKVLVDLVGSGVDLVRCMHDGGDMKDS